MFASIRLCYRHFHASLHRSNAGCMHRAKKNTAIEIGYYFCACVPSSSTALVGRRPPSSGSACAIIIEFRVIDVRCDECEAACDCGGAQTKRVSLRTTSVCDARNYRRRRRRCDRSVPIGSSRRCRVSPNACGAFAGDCRLRCCGFFSVHDVHGTEPAHRVVRLCGCSTAAAAAR